MYSAEADFVYSADSVYTCNDCLLTVFDDWYTIVTLLVQSCRHVTLGTPIVIFAVLIINI